MGSHIIFLIAVIVYCSEIHSNALPTSVAKPEDTVLAETRDSQVTEKRFLWENLDPSSRRQPIKKPTKIEESNSPNNASGEMRSRKSRFLNSLAFLAGLSFGGLATAASSTVKSIAKLPSQASLSLNLNDAKTSPYIAAYYSPVLPYPFIYPSSFKIVPVIDPTRPQANLPNDLTAQVISVFDQQPNDLAGSNEDYANEGKEPENRADVISQAEADRNAEEKTMIRGCKGSQRKYDSSSKGSSRERENFHVDADSSRALFNFKVKANMTDGNANQTANTTTPATTNLVGNNSQNVTYYPPYFPFPGYFGGYPQNVNHVDLTTNPSAYHYGYDQINYNPSHEQTHFYHDDRYNVHSSSSHLPGPYSFGQTNEYVDANFDRLYHSEYQSPTYSDGFQPVK
ncbi:uncharacterized protein LOC109863812 [Pseudomyrmex gracilis]|uniref:uncharacterized protein LOC109863812 n=1 Tax=Pseudomyrmex gracilis TaxID=219809 RepID=UPI0009953695|nr:uncharacterized protein LOC109863812 [Pseudomyrmex gracilis]